MSVHPSVKGLLRPQFLAIAENVFLKAPPAASTTAQQKREARKARPALTAGMQTAHTVKDIQVERVHTQGDAIPVRIWTPHGSTPHNGFPVVVHCHGGGWVLGDLDTEAVHCSNMCAKGQAVVVSVDYRLAPEHPYPAGPDDLWEAYRWVVANSTKLGTDPERIAVAGGSSGANLITGLIHRIARYNRTAPSDPVPTAKLALLLVPLVDVKFQDYWTAETFKHAPDIDGSALEWFNLQYFGSLPNVDTSDPLLSPLKASDEDFSLHPPAFIATAETDILRGQGEAYAARLMRNAVPVLYKTYKGVGHAFPMFPGIVPECDEVIHDMSAHLRAHFYGES